MLLRVAPEISRRFPDLAIAYLVAEGVDNLGAAQALRAVMDAEVERLRERFADAKALLEHPALAAWQRSYRAMGLAPKKVRPASVALARRAYKSGPPPPISPAVDAYLVAELRHLVPIGGHDLDTIEGDIVLRPSPGGEPFVPIGGDADAPELTLVDEVVYADDRSVLTRHWNYRDCERAKIDPSTRRLALFAESADAAIDAEQLLATLTEVRELMAAHCGGRYGLGLIDAGQPEAELAIT